ncbi:MAG: AMP-binding protein [Nannocystaceae bacterium]
MSARTLAGLLRARADARADEVALRTRDGEGWRERTWATFWAGARRAGAGLWARGVRPGDHVLMLVPEVEAAILTLFGAWSIGAVPVQIGLPLRLTDVAGVLGHLEETARRLDASALVIGAALAAFAPASAAIPVHVAESLLDAEPGPELPDPESRPAGAALIQLTSGSTGRRAGGRLSHDRVLHHMESMSRALPSRADSVAVSWLPLHHDMGLLGGLLFPFYNGFVAHMMSPMEFRGSPFAWLEAMSTTGATICAAPPSAYSMLLRLAPRAIAAGLDLSRWECAMIGAEPISAALLRRFAEAFAPCGFRPEAFFPVYGLAEATVAVTFPGLLAPTRVDRVDRRAIEGERRATPGERAGGVRRRRSADPGDRDRDRRRRRGAALERRIGEIRVQAPSMMRATTTTARRARRRWSTAGSAPATSAMSPTASSSSPVGS